MTPFTSQSTQIDARKTKSYNQIKTVKHLDFNFTNINIDH